MEDLLNFESILTRGGFHRNIDASCWRVYEQTLSDGRILALTTYADGQNVSDFNACVPPTGFPVILWECDSTGEWYNASEIHDKAELETQLGEAGVRPAHATMRQRRSDTERDR
jgi:hypothetical protein